MKKEYLRLLYMYAYSEQEYLNNKLYYLLYNENLNPFMNTGL